MFGGQISEFGHLGRGLEGFGVSASFFVLPLFLVIGRKCISRATPVSFFKHNAGQRPSAKTPCELRGPKFTIVAKRGRGGGGGASRKIAKN